METNIGQTTHTNMNSEVSNFNVSSQQIDEPGMNAFTYWNNDNWTEYISYYKTIPELKKSIDALAMWTVGRGFTVENARKEVILENITGWGEDTFTSILWNMLVVKKINGDSYAEIIRDERRIINLKPLNPLRVKIAVDEKGIIGHYIYESPKGKEKRIETKDMFHLSNDRIANEIHGTSVIEACKWIIDARNEAMKDWRRILHRSTLRVMFIDADDTTRLNHIKTQYAEALDKGELILLPAKKGEVEFEDLQAPPLETFLGWIRYLEDNFYKAVGVPKIILGGSDEYAEAGAKVGYLTFEQPARSEQEELEKDIKNQLGIQIKFNEAASIKQEMGKSEAANTGQLNFQPNETRAGISRSE